MHSSVFFIVDDGSDRAFSAGWLEPNAQRSHYAVSVTTAASYVGGLRLVGASARFVHQMLDAYGWGVEQDLAAFLAARMSTTRPGRCTTGSGA
jgi:hypothetical protein